MNGTTPSGTMFLHPERIVGYLGVEKGMTVADFGAGSGFYSIPLARKTGDTGKVYAIDIQKPALDLIKSKAQTEHLFGVETVWADLELPSGSHLPNDVVDLVIVANILFQAEDKAAILKEAYRILKPGGRIALIEWDETPFPGGPPAESRVPKRALQSLLAGVHFSPDREFEAGSHHYGILYKKQ